MNQYCVGDWNFELMKEVKAKIEQIQKENHLGQDSRPDIQHGF